LFDLSNASGERRSLLAFLKGGLLCLMVEQIDRLFGRDRRYPTAEKNFRQKYL
jgi:hypothetical protein